jgi:hypothetical protein
VKARDALDVGASSATVIGFVVGVVVLAWSAVNDKIALGLAVALVASVLLNMVLLVTVRRKPKPPMRPDPMLAVLAAMANPGPKYRVPSMERLTVSVVLDYMNEAMGAFEADNAHGSVKSGDGARRAAREAKTKAEGISDTAAREAVGLFEEAIIHSPRGWKEQGGANLEQMNKVRDAHTLAVRLVGALLRPVEPEVSGAAHDGEGSGSA